MNKIRIGVFGAGRGESMMRYCLKNNDAELVAVCDKSTYLLEKIQKKLLKAKVNTKLFTDFEEFLQTDMDAVILANYANDHAPYAIRCLQKGLHVMSEVLPCETLAEAVELCEAVEKSKKVYFYSENYCYFPGTREMKRLYQQGVLGDFSYGEGEYIHNCEDCWASLTKASPDHWRNTKSAFFYSTHSAGPLIHITGLRPVKVKGIEGLYSEKMKSLGAGGAGYAVEMVTLDNGGVFKSIHGGGLSGNSIWYNLYGTKGQIETARETSFTREAVSKVYFHSKDTSFQRKYRVGSDRRSYCMGHGGSDWYTMHNFIKKINGQEADAIDVYEALDMFFVGHFGYFSAFEGGKEVTIPDFRNKEVREKYRNDHRCCTPEKGKEQTLPSNTQGGMDCSPETYEKLQIQLDKYYNKEGEKVTFADNVKKLSQYIKSLLTLHEKIK